MHDNIANVNVKNKCNYQFGNDFKLFISLTFLKYFLDCPPSL